MLKFEDEPWLTQTLTLGKTSVLAAGQVRDVAGIDARSMRVMGSFGLIYMVAVEGYYQDELGTCQDLRSGDVVWIYPGVAHAYGPRPGTRWTQVYVILAGSQWERWREEGVLDPGRPVTHAEPVDFWQRRIRELFSDAAAHRRAASLRLMAGLLQLVPDLLAAQEESEESRDDDWLAESRRLLDQRPVEHDWTPQAVARQVGLGYENFRKRFAAGAGLPPGQYQRRRRIEQACAAIYQGTSSFKVLAQDLGFCDVYHFSKAFRQITGETPSQFRGRVRGL